MGQYYMTFKEWFEGQIAWFLKQRPELTSEAEPYQRMDSARVMEAVNIIISDLVIEGEERFRKVITHTFSEDTYRFQLPAQTAKLLGFTYSDYEFQRVPSETELGYSIRKESDDTLVNDDGWTKGDVLILDIVERPPRISSENDILRFPTEYLELLTLRVIDWVKIQSGEASTLAQNQEYMRLLQRWRKDKGRIAGEFRKRKTHFTGIGR